VLGPVEVRVGGRVVAVGPRQQQLLLAALAVDAGYPVTVETLIDRLWDQAPDEVRRALRVLITRLRRTVKQAVNAEGEAVRIVRRSGGYALEIDPQRVDVLRFRRLIAEARESQCPADKRVALLRQAVALWRGEPLSGLAGGWAARIRRALHQQHLDAVVAWARAELQAGDPAAVVDLLTELVGEHPLVESLAEVLMRALCATGRSTQALSVYATIRQQLVEELGTDPGPALQAVHQQILRGTLTPGTPHDDTQTLSVPRQLPAAVAHFAGHAYRAPAQSG
jgi:DNA-binding SARP family transcriptional activator